MGNACGDVISESIRKTRKITAENGKFSHLILKSGNVMIREFFEDFLVPEHYVIDTLDINNIFSDLEHAYDCDKLTLDHLNGNFNVRRVGLPFSAVILLCLLKMKHNKILAPIDENGLKAQTFILVVFAAH